MNNTSPTTSGLKWSVLIFLAVFLAGGLIGWLLSDRNSFLFNPAPVELSPDFQREYEHGKRRIADLQRQVELKADTVMRLKTQLGYTGIALNRSEAKVQEYANRIRNSSLNSADAIIWSPELKGKLLDCDSLAVEIQDVYIDAQNAREALADSLNVFYESIIADKDSTIAQYSRIDTSSFTELAKVQAQRDQAQNQLKKANRKKHIGWIAAGIGAFFSIVAAIF